MATTEERNSGMRKRRLHTQVTPRLERALMARLARLRFSRHPALRVDLRQEAYSNYAFGARSGPTVDFENLCHELAHAAQFDPREFDERCTAEGEFCLTIGKLTGEDWCRVEPVTAGCTLRECEVFAIQYHLLEYTGKRLDFNRYAQDVVQLCSWLPDWWTLGGIEGRKTEIPEQLRRFMSAWTAERAIERITVWLDKTQARLAQKH